MAISAILLQLNELLTGSSEIQYALLFLLLPNVAYGRTLSYLFQRRTAAKRIADAHMASNADAEEGKNPTCPPHQLFLELVEKNSFQWRQVPLW
jgi:hypothetical protein